MATQVLPDPAPPSRLSPSDCDLVRRLRSGDMAAFDAIVVQYRTAVVKYAARFLDRPEGADDVAHDAFLRLWEHRREWAPTSRLGPLLLRIARNLALNEKRRTRVHRRGEARVLRTLDRRGPTPVEEAEATELRSRVDAAVGSLPTRRREVFVLARFQNLSYGEIAAVLDISPQTVANQMSAALSHLRGELRDFLELPEALPPAE